MSINQCDFCSDPYCSKCDEEVICEKCDYTACKQCAKEFVHDLCEDCQDIIARDKADHSERMDSVQ